ncbi:MAG TPA: serine/threonine-protein kinase [Rudaea sp.]|jgi:serine/threonine-protein kinase|nr:serine/threonine-protein kinase [Rudaea sp.]
MQPDNEPTSDAGSRLREAFDVLSEMSALDREAWLAANVSCPAQRQELLRLLAEDDASGFLDESIVEHARRLDSEEMKPEVMIGHQIGVFRIVRLLGQGGMASVFLGERTGGDFQQTVAVKILRRGLFSELEQRLFLRERRVLATLDHPNIARLIDGGVTDAGIPYLVMEYVDGEPITRYAELCELDVRRRAELFLTVCRAVEAAHRSLIVHRDIKPSNVLVSADGATKLLDFGIAKLIEEDDTNASGTVGVFTPNYAAPEQIRGGVITTATDVYSLGVLLHEMLLGIRPEGSTRRPSSRVTEAARTTSGNATARVSTLQLRSALRGDLDNILMKALDEEPERRYPSAGALADDIDRYLHRRPVMAHPPSGLYRARKFVERHRGGVALTVMFLLALIAAFGATVWQANVARREAARANTVRDFVVGLFDAARAHLPRDQRPTPEVLVEQAELQLAHAHDFDPITHAELESTLGEVQLSLSNFVHAEKLFAQSEQRAMDAGQVDLARAAQVRRADAMQRAGRNADVIALLEPVLPTLRQSQGPTLLRALAVLAAADVSAGKPDDALKLRRDAVGIAQNFYGKDNLNAIEIEFKLADALNAVQDFPAAKNAIEAALERWRAAHGPQDDRYVAALGVLASATDGMGDTHDTEAHYRELLALKRTIYPAPHDSIAATLRDLGIVLTREEKFADAKAALDEALAMDKAIFGENHVETASTYHAMGESLIMQRKFADGEADYRRAIAICEAANIHEELCPRARNDLGMAYYRELHFDDAKTEMTAALKQRRALFGDNHPSVAYSLVTLASVAVVQKNYPEAVKLSSEALDILHRAGRDKSIEAVFTRNTYAQALWMVSRDDEALAEINRVLDDWQRIAPTAKARRIPMLVQKAQILKEMKRDDEARRTADEAIALQVDPTELAALTKKLLRQLSGRTDVYPEVADAPAK